MELEISKLATCYPTWSVSERVETQDSRRVGIILWIKTVLKMLFYS